MRSSTSLRYLERGKPHGSAPLRTTLPAGVLGLAGGALVGRMMDTGVDGKFVKQVEEEIQPGTSALFVLVGNANP